MAAAPGPDNRANQNRNNKFGFWPPHARVTLKPANQPVFSSIYFYHIPPRKPSAIVFFFSLFVASGTLFIVVSVVPPVMFLLLKIKLILSC